MKLCCTMLHIWVIFPLLALKGVSSLILYKTKLTLSFCNGGAFHPKFILFPSPPMCIFYEEKGNCVALCCTFGWNSLCSRSKESLFSFYTRLNSPWVFVMEVLSTQNSPLLHQCVFLMNKTKSCCTMLHIWVKFPLLAFKGVFSVLLFSQLHCRYCLLHLHNNFFCFVIVIIIVIVSVIVIRVAKCKFLYTEQIFPSKFYPKKSA